MSDDPNAQDFVSGKTQHFDRVWGGVGDIADAIIASGETSLSRVLRLTEAAWREVDGAPANGSVYGGPVTLPRAALIGGRQHFHARTLMGQCGPDTDLIVELGSGWGLNVLDLYLAGGPRRARYRGLELSAAGRACATRLAALEPELDFAAHPFNYLQPDYSPLPRGQHAVVFSSHSVEQIPYLPPAAIIGLLELGERITGVHFEPVGWQIRRAKGLPEVARGATEDNAERNNYNRDFWTVLEALERKGRIAIKVAEADILGHKPKNVSSLVIWEKVGR